MSGTSNNNAGSHAEGAPRDPPGDSALILEGIRALHDRLYELEAKVVPGALHRPGEPYRPGGGLHFIPAWRRPTQGETRWPVALAVAAAAGLQIPLPGRVVLLHPTWLLPLLEGLLLMALVIANPSRINTESRLLRMLGLTVAALLSLANAWSVVKLVIGLVQGTEGGAPARC